MDKTDHVEIGLLVNQYRTGDVLALQKLVKLCHKSFCEKAFWYTKDTEASKDIAQESWKVIISKINTLKDPSSFKSWALRIVFSKAMDRLRNNQKEISKLKSYHHTIDLVEEEPNDNEPLKKQLLLSIKSLSADQQIVLRYFYVEEYSLKEISDFLEISVGTVKSRLFHAREKLKEQLKNRNYEMS